MQKLNNRYVKIGAICLLTFVFARIIIAISNTYVDPDIPFPFVLSLITSSIIGWFAAKAIRY